MKPLRLLIVVSATACLGFPALAQQHPNEARGFAADKLYDFHEIDSVNMFNGNLGLRIPIGPEYTASGKLAYRLMLVYNSHCWHYETSDPTPAGDPGPIIASPVKSSNAGMGWLLSLGRLFSPTDPLNQSKPGRWVYETADGSDHLLGDTLHGETQIPLIQYTRDSSYIRMRGLSPRMIELPDGTMHVFSEYSAQQGSWPEIQGTDRWRLKQIKDRHGNTVNIGYSRNTTYREIWTISDGARTTIVYFLPSPAAQSGEDVALHHIDFQGFGGAISTYDFDVRSISVPPGFGDTSGRNTIPVPVLASIQFPSISGGPRAGYSMLANGVPSYDASVTTPGILTRLQLPTLGSISWTFEVAEFPAGVPDSAKKPSVEYPSFVRERKTRDALGNELGVWSYGHVYSTRPAGPSCNYSCGGGLCTSGKSRQKTSWVTAPGEPIDGGGTGPRVTTVSYFSTYKRLANPNGDTCDATPENWESAEYGLPFTRYEPKDNRYLSVQTLTGAAPSLANWDGRGVVPTGGVTGRTLIRSEYVRYEIDADAVGAISQNMIEANARLSSQATYFHDDPGCLTCYKSTDLTGFDGFGHYRQTVEDGNFPDPTGSVMRPFNARTTFVKYPNTLNGNGDWVLNTFSEQCTANERAGAITSCSQLPGAVVTLTNFDRETGRLLARRSLLAAANGSLTRGATDLLAIFTYDSHGNVSFEKYYGGDNQLIGVADDFTPPAASPKYQINHTFTYNANGAVTAHKTTYDSMSFFISDEDMDVWAGLVKTSRDVSGLSTTYEYDAQWRLSRITPPHGRSAATCNYSDANVFSGMFTPAKALVRRDSAFAGSLQREYQYDALGRLWRDKTLMPDNTWSIVERRYDPSGRQLSVSSPEKVPAAGEATFVPAFKTKFSEFDPFDRVRKITGADSKPTDIKETTFAYDGIREMRRTQTIATSPSGAEAPKTSTETYDALGRLRRVAEPSGPSETSTTTDYEYDAGGRLSSVKMIGGGVAQNRIFDYDGRGFLRWESHPESGMTSYVYDARGNVVSKYQAAANSKFDLNYFYDPAERLIEIDGRNPGYTSGPAEPDNQVGFRPLKEFVYGMQNDLASVPNYQKGKLSKAVRYNYPEISGLLVRVTEEYKYEDSSGRKTGRTTTIDTRSYPSSSSEMWSPVRQVVQGVTYNELDLPASIDYPLCLDCGMPPQNPPRNLAATYSNGRPVAIPNFLSTISYWPNGMRNEALHTNQIKDTQTADGGMSRPLTMTAEFYKSCDAPLITTEPQGGNITSSTPTVTLTVVASGTSLSYQWYGNQEPITGATGPTLAVSPSSTTFYQVMVSNTCRTVASRAAKVSVNDCSAPSVSWADGTLNADRTVMLSANAGGTEPFSYSWYRSADNSFVQQGAKITTGPISATTSYYVKVSNQCGFPEATRTVMVGVPLPMPGSGLVASWNGANQITVTWPAVAGATTYVVQRRSGTGWISQPPVSAPQFFDTNIAPSTTYAYRVYARDANEINISNYSNVDVATTMTFTAVNTQMSISAGPLNELLQAVNCVRAAAGWSPVGWSNILSANDPLPQPGASILAAHITAPRARINEALHALGAPAGGYVDPDPKLQSIRAEHILEVQRRAQ